MSDTPPDVWTLIATTGIWMRVACVCAIAAIVYLLTSGPASPQRTPRGAYRSKRILTPNEQEFYRRLKKALPTYAIFTQVSMSAIIEPRQDHRDAEYMRLRAKFAQKYIDFLICESGSLRVIAIVELDDVTHDIAKDRIRDDMLEGAGYNVVRWHSRKKPTTTMIAKTIRQLHLANNYPDP